MERLLYSSYPTPFRIQLKSPPLLPRLARADSSKLNFRPEFARVTSISVKHENPFPILSSGSAPFVKLLGVSASRVDSANGSVPDSRFDESGDGGESRQKKTVPAIGKLVLLSALIMMVISPALVPPAFATFQTATSNTGKSLFSGELLSSAWTGFFAGCLHTLSGPDHLAALAPLSIGRTRMESAAVGALWGCGHDAGQVLFGLIFLLLKDRLHIEIIQAWGARVVGFTLIAIGVMGIREASEVPTPCVALENGECDVSAYEALENPTGGKKKIGFATFATGIVHGLQPDALMMVLPALALPSRIAGAAYLGMFLLGTVFAMGSYTVFIGSFSQVLQDRVPRITEKLTWASSLIAIALGLAIIFSQFLGYSLY